MTDNSRVLGRRRAGVLLHLGSLEGGLGASGRAFVDWLAQAGFTVWQMLPAGPTGTEGSPYWVRSDAAGNPNFIDAAEPAPHDGPEYQAFLAANADWLPDYACFEILSMLHRGASWWQWAPEYRDRDPAALAGVRDLHALDLKAVYDRQFQFAWQWQRLREYAHSRGVLLFGDVPFYVAPDSAEVWSERAQFQLDPQGHALAVAGVPPDYFSELGQLWGNTLYDWDAMRKDGFRFWQARLRWQLARVDLLRLDHFRALAAHWSVPAGAPDARGGHWVPTPGRELLGQLTARLGELPLVAEDLGVITDDVTALRRDFKLPGMRVLQFGFDGSGINPHLPHMHEHDSIIYTGTHDNDTTLGWYRSLDPAARWTVDQFLNQRGGDPDNGMPEALIRACLGSVGELAVIPAQDLLSLGSEARLNTPGTVVNNWSWRLPRGALTPERAQHFATLNRIYGRT